MGYESSGLLGIPTPDLLAPALGFVTSFGQPAIQKIFLPTDVTKQYDNFLKDSAKDALAFNDTLRAAGAPVTIRQSSRDKDNYEVVNDELAEKVPVEDVAKYPNALQEAANKVTLAVVRSLERRGAVQLAAATVTAGTNFYDVGGSSTPWTTVASCTPSKDVNVAAGYIRANIGVTKSNLSLAIPRKHLEAFSQITDFRSTLSVTTDITGQQKLERLAAYFGVREVIVLEMQYDSANTGQSLTAADCWDSNNAYLFWNTQNNPDGTVPKLAGMGRMFVWPGPADHDESVYQEMMQMAAGYQIPPVFLRQWYDQSTKSYMVGAGTYTQTKIIKSQCLARLGGLG